MKKSGIINGRLIGELTKVGHTGEVVICDAGFPVPTGANVIDLALVGGVPGFRQTLCALTNEFIFEGYVIFDTMKVYNREYYDFAVGLLTKQKQEEMTFSQFIERTSRAKLVIRTGELAPCSNIILISASGVSEEVEKYTICDNAEG